MAEIAIRVVAPSAGMEAALAVIDVAKNSGGRTRAE